MFQCVFQPNVISNGLQMPSQGNNALDVLQSAIAFLRNCGVSIKILRSDSQYLYIQQSDVIKYCAENYIQYDPTPC